MEAYYKWVRIRAQKLGMPYEAVRPVILEYPDRDGAPPTVLPPQIPTDLDTLKRSWAQLREERCCTPKFALPYSSRNCQIMLQNSPRVAQCKSLLNSQN